MRTAVSMGALVVLCTALGCGDVSYDSVPIRYAGPVNHCGGSGDCPKGYTCDESSAMCVLKGGELNRALIARVIPKGMNPQLFPLRYTEAGTRNVFYFKPNTIERRVYGAEDHLTTIAARVVVHDLQTFPGIPSYSVSAVVSEGGGAASNAQFSLADGERRYRIDVLPTSGNNVPPRYYDNVSVKSTVSEDGSKRVVNLYDEDGLVLDDFTLPVCPDENKKKGRILRGVQPAEGLSVQMVDPDTGRFLSNPVVTGCGETGQEDAVCGDFTLSPSRVADPYYIKIWNASDSAYPVVTIPSTASVPDSSKVDVYTLPFLSNPVHFGARVERRVRISKSGELSSDPAANCLVVFEANPQTTEMDSVFFIAKTDASGNIVGEKGNPWVYLYPDDYRVTIIPPGANATAREDYALLESIQPISDNQFKQVFVLDYKYYASFHIRAGGRDVPETVVEAVPVDPVSPYAKISYSQPQPDKSQRLWLDKGKYRLTVKVPSESGYAFTSREIFIEENPDTLFGPVEVQIDDFLLPFPSVAKLHIDSGEGVALEGATVEWYEQQADGNAVSVAVSTVDGDGNTVGLLPPY